MKELICNDCGYEWSGDEGYCPECDSENTSVIGDEEEDEE